MTFNEPGEYLVTLEALNADGSCAVQSETKTVVVSPIPYIEHNAVSICSGEVIGVDPLPGSIVPPGTVYDWTVTDNLDLSGIGEGSSENDGRNSDEQHQQRRFR